MTATNAVAVKAALLALIQGLPLTDVQAGYGPPANPERDFIYLGSARGPIQPAAMRNGGRVPRIENLTLQVHIVANVPGGTSVEVLAAETRAVEIYTEIVHAVAADPQLDGLPGLTSCLVADMELNSAADDDGSTAWVVVSFEAKSLLK